MEIVNKMIEWYLNITRLTREMRGKAFDALEALVKGEKEKAKIINEYLANDFKSLISALPSDLSVSGNLGRHIRLVAMFRINNLT